jgi:hypothetical protein
MPKVIVCRACGAKSRLPDQFPGRKAKCPHCAGVISLDGSPSTAPAPRPAPRPAPAEADDEIRVVARKERPSPRPAEPVVADYDEPEEEDVPVKKKKRKKRRSRRAEGGGAIGTWIWWYVALACVVLAIVAGGFLFARAGHAEDAIFFGIELAIMTPVSMVILVISMLLASTIAGGISFGEIHTAIPKAALLILAVNLVTLIPFGIFFTLPIWVVGAMYAFDLDFWEARFLIAVNWMLNFGFKLVMLHVLLSMILHGKGDVEGMDSLVPSPRRSASAPAPASAQEKAMDKIHELGGECEDDEDADDIRIIGVNLAGSNVTDADLVHLKEFPALRRLDLSSTRITDQGLTHLKGLKQLQMINLQGTKVTAGGVAELQKALPAAKILTGEAPARRRR